MSPRHTYGDAEIIGLEFRSSVDPHLSTLIQDVAAFLEGWEHYDMAEDEDIQYQLFKVRREDSNPATYSLRDIPTTLHMPTATDNLLPKEVKEVINATLTSCKGSPDCFADGLPWSQDFNFYLNMENRWSMIAIPWESHPALLSRCIGNKATIAPWNDAASIVKHRKKTYEAISKLVVDPSDAVSNMNHIHSIVSDFFQGLYLCF